MRKSWKNVKGVWAFTTALLLVLVSAPAFATNYVVYIHGKGGDSSALADTNNSRWGNSDSYGPAYQRRSTAWGASRFVNYDSTQDPRSSGSTRAQTKLANAISAYCSGTNKCIVLCHSAGCYAMEYYFATKTAPTGLLYVVTAASASGGSVVADYGTTAALLSPLLALIGLGVAGEPNAMTISLRTDIARSFNHNLSPVNLYNVAGYKSVTPVNVIVPGQDDKLVNFAGACGYTKNGTMTNCADGNNAKYSKHVTYCSSDIGCNTSNKGYNFDHSAMQPVGRNVVDKLLGYL